MSSTCTGCSRVPPSPKSGTIGSRRTKPISVVSNASLGPNITLGRRIVAPRNPKRTASSPWPRARM
jgi:hypothetical protein